MLAVVLAIVLFEVVMDGEEVEAVVGVVVIAGPTAMILMRSDSELMTPMCI